MNNQKPLMSRWYVKVTLVILCIAVAFLMAKFFTEGYKEEKQMKANKSQNK